MMSTSSRYLQLLPAALQEGEFLGRFLLAFEALLTGLDDPSEPEGIERKLDRIHSWFDPLGEDPVGNNSEKEACAPDAFLPWLAEWVAVSLQDHWTLDFKRRFIRGAVSLYRKRGTLEGMRELLKLRVPDTQVEVSDEGTDRGGRRLPDHFFRVSFTVNARNRETLFRLAHEVRTLIEQEKPAHTFYSLEIRFPTMQISSLPEKRLRVGSTTILGTGTLTY